jgi:hypothetical protein
VQPSTAEIEKRCTKCGQLKPATLDWFMKDARRVGAIGSWCKGCFRVCQTKAQKRRRKNRREGVVPETAPYFYGPSTWCENKWVELSADTVRAITYQARRKAFEKGHGWLADDVAQFAIIEAHQGIWVSAELSFFKVFDIEYGYAKSKRREFELASRFTGIDENESESENEKEVSE